MVAQPVRPDGAPANLTVFPGRRVASEDRPGYDAGSGQRAKRPPFAMIPRHVSEEYAAKAGLAAWGLFAVLAQYADEDGACWPSHQTLAKATGASRATVIRAIKKLQAIGLVQVEQRSTGEGAKTSNLYRIPALKHVSPADIPSSTSAHPHVSPADIPCITGGHKQEPVNENHVERDTPPTPPKGEAPAGRKSAKARLTPWPDGFALTDDLRRYAEAKGIRPDRVDAVFDDFHDKALAKAYRYADWERAWQAWVRSPYQDRDRALVGPAAAIAADEARARRRAQAHGTAYRPQR